jgi:two-component system chemotaxis response regulator CheB
MRTISPETPTDPMSQSRTQTRFERAHPDGTLTDLGCPVCPGVLEVQPAGHKGYLTFVCRIGHAFSPQTLIDAKEEALEEALWSAATRLDELVSIYEDFIPRMEKLGRRELAAAYRQRLDEARTVLARVQELARVNRPPLEPRAE